MYDAFASSSDCHIVKFTYILADILGPSETFTKLEILIVERMSCSRVSADSKEPLHIDSQVT